MTQTRVVVLVDPAGPTILSGTILAGLMRTPGLDVYATVGRSGPSSSGNAIRHLYERLEYALHARHLRPAPSAPRPTAKLPDGVDLVVDLVTRVQAPPLILGAVVLTPFYEQIPLAQALDRVFHDCLGGRATARLSVALTDGATAQILAEGVYRLNPDSFVLTCQTIAKHLAGMLGVAGQRLQNGLVGPCGGGAFRVQTPGPAQGLAASGAAIFQTAFRKAGQRLRGAGPLEQWILLYAVGATLEETLRHPERMRRITPPPDRFWADPFPLVHEGRSFIFFEECLYRENKGRICALELNEQGPGEARVVLERDHHLSYPFLWREDGALYMIPESAQNRRVDLYRCTDFPDQWELEATLLENITAKDATLLRHEGLYWLFAKVSNFDDNGEHLHIHYAPALRGPWQAHACNPVLSDAGSARPAGGFLTSGPHLYRAGQDCSARYGAAIVLNRVEELTRSSYRETTMRRIALPGGGEFSGFHTINVDGPLIAADALLIHHNRKNSQ